MTFEIENVYPEVVLPDYETVIKNVIEAALDYEKCPYEAQVYVLLTDNEEIHEINKEHRQIDRPTAALPAFPAYSSDDALQIMLIRLPGTHPHLDLIPYAQIRTRAGRGIG